MKCSTCRTSASFRFPLDPGSYYPEDHTQRTDLKTLDIVQPDGVSYAIDGNLSHWQKWSLRVSMDALEGLVLHQVAYDGRSILHRASISEMVVPYGDPGADARLEERVRRGRVGPRPHGEHAHARLRLSRRDPLPRLDLRR